MTENIGDINASLDAAKNGFAESALYADLAACNAQAAADKLKAAEQLIRDAIRLLPSSLPYSPGGSDVDQIVAPGNTARDKAVEARGHLLEFAEGTGHPVITGAVSCADLTVTLASPRTDGGELATDAEIREGVSEIRDTLLDLYKKTIKVGGGMLRLYGVNMRHAASSATQCFEGIGEYQAESLQ